MGQRLALVAVEKNDVARLGLLFAQLQAQTHPFHLAFRLTSLQRVPGPPPAELFFRKALDSCERLMRTPSRASISAKARDRPVTPVGHRLFQQGGGHAQGGFTLHRGRPWRDARLQRRDAAGGEVAAPEANCVLAHAKRLRDPGAGPTRQRQQHGARPVGLSAIARTG
jgi:hypothetical protein